MHPRTGYRVSFGFQYSWDLTHDYSLGNIAGRVFMCTIESKICFCAFGMTAYPDKHEHGIIPPIP